MTAAVMEDVQVNANISGTNAVGGIVGAFDLTQFPEYTSNLSVYSKINRARYSGTIIGTTGVSNVGGIVGSINQIAVEITNSYSKGEVKGTSRVGGLVGGATSGALKVANAYAAAKVTATTSKGGAVGYISATTTSYTNLFYDKTISGQSDTGKGVGKTTSEMLTQATFTGYDFTSVWKMEAAVNGGYPYIVVVASVVPDITSTTHLNVGIQPGAIAILVPATGSFSAVTLNGTNQQSTAALGLVSLSDFTGASAGYRVTVSATPFTAAGPSGYTLPTGSLTLKSPSSVIVVSGSAALAPSVSGTTNIIDAGSPVQVASAGVGKGAGSYNLSFDSDALKLMIGSNIRLDTITYPSSPTPYQSTITWSIAIGP
jgi:hypothetical protein